MGSKGLQVGIPGKMLQTLEEDLAKEQNQWKAPCYEENPEAGSATAARHAAAARLPALCGRLRFGADTLCLSVSLLDALLSRVRATPRHVACAALACLHLAAKLCEEDELVPTAQCAVEVARAVCSPSDLARMERLVLDKLDWQLRRVTPLHFLYSLHGLLVTACPQLLHHPPLRTLTGQLQRAVVAPGCAQVAPSLLAAALICEQLRRAGLQAQPLVDAAHRLIKCSPEELADARARVRAVPSGAGWSLEAPSSRQAAASAAKRPRQRGDSRSFSRPAKRPLVTPSADDIVGDIRCLYAGEETNGGAADLAAGCCRAGQVGPMSYADALRSRLPAAAAV